MLKGMKKIFITLIFVAIFLFINPSTSFAAPDPTKCNIYGSDVYLVYSKDEPRPQCSPAECEKNKDSPCGLNNKCRVTCYPPGPTTKDPTCGPGYIASITSSPPCCPDADDNHFCDNDTRVIKGYCGPDPKLWQFDLGKGCVAQSAYSTASKWVLQARCDNETVGIQTAVGCVPTGKLDLTLGFVLKFALGAAGGVIVLMLIVTGYGLLTSQGNPEKLAAAKENIVSIFSGLILIVFSLILLQTIGAGILGLPTFGP